MKHQCRRVTKLHLTKHEINKNIFLFTTNYKDIEKLKDDKRPSIRKISEKVMEKLPGMKAKKNMKIKIRIKSKEFTNKEDKKDKKE